MSHKHIRSKPVTPMSEWRHSGRFGQTPDRFRSSPDQQTFLKLVSQRWHERTCATTAALTVPLFDPTIKFSRGASRRLLQPPDRTPGSLVGVLRSGDHHADWCGARYMAGHRQGAAVEQVDD